MNRRDYTKSIEDFVGETQALSAEKISLARVVSTELLNNFGERWTREADELSLSDLLDGTELLYANGYHHKNTRVFVSGAVEDHERPVSQLVIEQYEDWNRLDREPVGGVDPESLMVNGVGIDFEPEMEPGTVLVFSEKALAPDPTGTAPLLVRDKAGVLRIDIEYGDDE